MNQHCRYLPSSGISIASLVILFPNLHTQKPNLNYAFVAYGSFFPVPSVCHKRTILTRPFLIPSFPLEWEEGDEKSSQMEPQTALDPV